MKVSAKIIVWARERMHLDEEELARKMQVRLPRVQGWETGELEPTYKQAKTLAAKLHIPFSYLFLNKEPEEKLPIPDLRTICDEDRHTASPDLLDTVYAMQQKQQWFRDYLVEEECEPLPILGKFTKRSKVKEIANDICSTLKLNSIDKKLSNCIQVVEDAGIIVVVNGVVGNNTHRPLSLEEFRGFALHDDYAPLIFINGKDSEPARVFTLFHELAHIWIGESGASNLGISSEHLDEASAIERKCNQVAIECLCPESHFLDSWDDSLGLDENIKVLKPIFHVSNLAIARRALDLKKISFEMWFDYYKMIQAHFDAKKKKGGGGNFYATANYRNSPLFAEALISSALEGKTSYREAYRMLGVKKTETFNRLAQELGF